MEMIKSFLYILLAVAIYSVVHSFLASLWMKEQARRLFGAEADRAYRLFYNGFAIVSLVPVMLMLAFMPDDTLYVIPFPFTILTFSIQALAGVALAVGIWQTGVWSFLGLQQFLEPPKKGPKRLVVHGLYRWVRHPLYTAGLVLIWLTPVMTVNVLALDLGITIYLILGAFVEERKLLKEYGPAYEEYCRTTPMLIPQMPPRKGE
jgi:protein-S-isoprenylcysteine O-methyltransferase Ste14